MSIEMRELSPEGIEITCEHCEAIWILKRFGALKDITSVYCPICRAHNGLLKLSEMKAH
jgi:hypothetical protein